MEGMGLIFTPVLVRCLFGPPGLSGPIMTSTSWTLNSLIGRYNLTPAVHPPYPPPTYPPPYTCNP